MSALVGEWIRRKVPARMPDSPIRSVAHVVVTHSCRPSRSPSHIVLFTVIVPNQERSADLRLTRPLCGPTTTELMRDSEYSLCCLLGVVALPTPQPFPTNLR
jgi:hypothetical protein